MKKGNGNIVFIGFDFFSKSDEWSNLLKKSFELNDKSVTCNSITVPKNTDPCKSGGITFTPDQGNGTITDGSGSANYKNNLRCTYTFNNNNQDAKLILNFKSFSLENRFDFLQVFNNPSRSKESNVALITGSGQPKNMVLTNPVNVLVFTSDCNNGFPGFEINYFWVIKQTVLSPSEFDQPNQPVEQIFPMKNSSDVSNLSLENNTSQQIESKLKNQDIVTMDGVIGYALTFGLGMIGFGAYWWFVGYQKIKVQNKRDKRNSERLVFTSVQIPYGHTLGVKPQQVTELENISKEIQVGERTYPSFWQDSNYHKIWRFVHVATDYPKFVKMCNTLKVKYWNSPYISQNIRGRGRSRSTSFRFTNCVVIPDDIRTGLNAYYEETPDEDNTNLLGEDIGNVINHFHQHDDFNQHLNNMLSVGYEVYTTYGHPQLSEIATHDMISRQASILAFTVKHCQIILAREIYTQPLKNNFIKCITRINEIIDMIFKVRNSYFVINDTKKIIKHLSKICREKQIRIDDESNSTEVREKVFVLLDILIKKEFITLHSISNSAEIKKLNIKNRIDWNKRDIEAEMEIINMYRKSYSSSAIQFSNKKSTYHQETIEESSCCNWKFWLNVPFLLFWILIFIFPIKILSTFLPNRGNPASAIDQFTFFGIGPQYNNFEKFIVSMNIPLLYAVMHNALYFFTIMPIFISKGIMSFIVHKIPSLRKWIPFDDFIEWHIFCGINMFLFVFYGLYIWGVTMSRACLQCTENEFAISEVNSVGIILILLFTKVITKLIKWTGNKMKIKRTQIKSTNKAITWILIVTLVILILDSCYSAIFCERNIIEERPIECDAFTPNLGEDSYFNLLVNVLFLRIVICLTLLPLVLPIFSLHKSNEFLCLRCCREKEGKSTFCSTWFYEIAMYIHRWMAFWICALVFVARAAIFFPAIITWCTCYIFSEIILKYTFFKYQAQVNINASIPSCNSENYKPTSVLLAIKDIKGLCCGSKMKLNAGQYICITIPEVDKRLGSLFPSEHVFSIASSSLEKDTILLNIQVQHVPGDIRIIDGRVITNGRETWTMALWQILKETQNGGIRELPVVIKGPYGSSFSSFVTQPNSLIVGGGTGITSALSALKERIHRIQAFQENEAISIPREKLFPKRLWFVWSCRNLDDLIWCWVELHHTLYYAIRHNCMPDVNPLTWSRESNTLGWFIPMIYITQMNDSDEKLFWKIVKEDIFMNTMQDVINNDINTLQLDSDKLVIKRNFLNRVFRRRREENEMHLLGETRAEEIRLEMRNNENVWSPEVRKDLLLEIHAFLVKHVVTQSMDSQGLYSLENVLKQVHADIGKEKIITYVTAHPQVVKLVKRFVKRSGLLSVFQKNHKF